MIKLENISKYYHNEGTVTLGLRKVNLELNLGEFVAVTGESGSGKSTLLNVISGIDSYEDGEMYINGEETSYFDDADWETYRRDSVGFIFQNYNLIDSYTVLQNVETALIIQGMDKKTRINKAKAIIDRVGLTSHLRHRASKLSGGEKQRLSIARALAKDTKIIVADEPTGNLDSESSKQILQLLKEVSVGRLVVIVTHDFENVEPFVTKKIRLFDGEIVENKELHPMNKQEVIEKHQGKMPLFVKILKIAFLNAFSQPKKSILLLFVAIMTLLFVFINYGSFIITSNLDVPSYSSFNSYPERLIVARIDKQAMDQDDLTYFNNLDEINEVITYDLIVDAQVNINFQIEDSYYYESGHIDIKGEYANKTVIGRVPQLVNEIAFAFNPYGADDQIADNVLNKELDVNISIINKYLQKKYKVVGIYVTTGPTQFIFSQSGLEELYQQVSISSFGYKLHIKSIDIDSDFEYYIIQKDSTLSGYEIILPDHILWNMSEEQLDSALVTLNGKTTSLVKGELVKGDEALRVSPAFFNELLINEDFQYTINLKDSDDTNRMIQKLKDNGYYAFSPYLASQSLDFDAIFSIVTKLFSAAGVVFSILVIFIISYLVVKTILLSKKKDYTILRIIGLNFKELKYVIVTEIISVFLIALVCVLSLFSLIITKVDAIADFLGDSIDFNDYLGLVFASFAVMLLISWQFTKMMTKKSLFMNLKVDGD